VTVFRVALTTLGATIMENKRHLFNYGAVGHGANGFGTVENVL
jgi:hypothetical protein